MLTGFRAGIDVDGARVEAAADFAATRAAWNLPAGAAQLARVFPANPAFGPNTPVKQVIARIVAACEPALTAGMWPYFSLKPDVAAAIAGQLDGHFDELGRWCATVGLPVYCSMWHEPENDTMAASSPLGVAQNFVSMHCRAYEHMKEMAGDSLRMGPCHMVYQWRPGSATTQSGQVAEAWRVPAGRRDFCAADAYTSNWSWKKTGATLEAKTDFQRWRTELQVPDGEIVLAERGISRTSQPQKDAAEQAQADVLAADFAYLGRIGAHALMYWNSAGATDDSVFTLGAPGRAVFVQAAAAAAIGPVSPTPPADTDVDRYDLGFTAGRAVGRREAFAEAAAWATRAGTTAAAEHGELP